jgi:TatD DNase family protein
MKYIDVHCHVNLPQYDADREDVIRRAQEADVGMIVVGTDRESSQNAVTLAEQHENIWAIVGLHPTEASETFGQTFDHVFDYAFYKKLAAHPKVVGIGECGLDYFHVDSATDENTRTQNHTRSRLFQMEVFESHIRLADELKKPLMLHVRNEKVGSGKSSSDNKSSLDKSYDAYADVIAILKKSKAAGMDVRGDVHFFAGDRTTAEQFIDLGFYLSFTGAITFANASAYREVIRVVPLDRILSETDAPFVSPMPYRGKRNEPVYVIEVAKAIAVIRNSDTDTGNTGDYRNKGTIDEREAIVLEALIENAKNLFKSV